MEENSNNFFAGVIEFRDGHQYKIESTNNNQLEPLRQEQEYQINCRLAQ